MTMKDIFSELVKAIKSRRRSDEFACGDCLRNAQCGQAPSDQCVARAAQIASGRRRMPKRETIVGC